MAAGVAEIRDLVAMAWDASEAMEVGFLRDGAVSRLVLIPIRRCCATDGDSSHEHVVSGGVPRRAGVDGTHDADGRRIVAGVTRQTRR